MTLLLLLGSRAIRPSPILYKVGSVQDVATTIAVEITFTVHSGFVAVGYGQYLRRVFMWRPPCWMLNDGKKNHKLMKYLIGLRVKTNQRLDLPVSIKIAFLKLTHI